MTQTSHSCSSPAFKQMLLMVGAACLLGLGCGSSGSGATTGGLLCTPGQSYACTGVASCMGKWTCQPEGTSYGPCECAAGSTGGTTGTGGRGSSTGTGSSTGARATTSGTGGALQTTFVGAVITPGAAGVGLMTMTIASENLGTTPNPGGVVNASGLWNSGSAVSGSYNTASTDLVVSSNAFSAMFDGMLTGEAINGQWVGDSYDWPFTLVARAQGETVRAFCGTNDDASATLGVVFSTDGTLAGVEGPAAGASSGTSGPLSGNYSNNLATVTGIGSFILSTDTDGGLSFVGTGWTMAPCQ